MTPVGAPGRAQRAANVALAVLTLALVMLWLLMFATNSRGPIP